MTQHVGQGAPQCGLMKPGHTFVFRLPPPFPRYTLLPIYPREFGNIGRMECLLDMRLNAPIRLLIVLVAILASAPASAQIYKWVDERGVTNYSNQPPTDPDAAKKLAIVEDRISVYTPDKALMRAIEAARQGSNQALSERVASLERQLEAERRARQYVSAAEAPAAYEPCQGGRAIDCSGFYSGYYPYFPAYVIAPYRPLPRNFVQARQKPGKIAGNVAGMNGFIPGNHAAASAGTEFPSRSFHAASTSRGFHTR